MTGYDECKPEAEGDVHGRPDVGGDYPQPRPTAKRGKFVNLAEREATAYTRRIGSCIRCRIQRIRVSIPAERTTVKAKALTFTFSVS